MGDLTAHFSSREFRCHCGCGRINVQLNLLQALEDVRSIIDSPIIIVSGYRCPDHNKAVGGAKKSYHMSGVAADIQAPGVPMLELYRAVIQVPAIMGVGLYLRPGGWIHVDVRRDCARWAEDENRRAIPFADAVKKLR